MTPLAMLGIVAPWLAAITMLISSLAVAWNAYRLYKNLVKNTDGNLLEVQMVS
jgi:cation transport ATPase